MAELTYEEVINQIENRKRFGNLTGVEIMGQILPQIGNPEAGMNIIHIAGTNGKGSVSAFLCAILQAAGIRCGMFTSPHLTDFEERIRVDGKMIPRGEVKRLGNFLLGSEFGVSPTMFDYCLAMGLLYFKEQKCDAVILETGLGGRLDSTNAVKSPVVSVITKIGYDHMEILGETLEKIALEKAGIIKPGTHLVLQSQTKRVNLLLKNAAECVGAADIAQVDGSEFKDCKVEIAGQEFSFRDYKKLKMKMLGSYQYENAAAAILAAEAFFAECDPKFTKEQMKDCIYAGIKNACWPGRMEILRKKPLLLADGAHNSCGVKALADSLKQLFPGETFHFIMGVMADKDYGEMVENLLPLAEDFRTVTVDSGRALKAQELAECIGRRGIAACACHDLSACLMQADLDSKKTVAFGSLYFIGELKAYFDGL